MKILITGAGGQLGRELARQLTQADEEYLALTKADLDITDEAGVEKCIGHYRPDMVINCAAYTHVDGCEEHQKKAIHVNGLAPGRLSAAAERHGAGIVHISTDYVFSGKGERDEDGRLRPYIETDRPDPVSVYGMSKLLGEQEVMKHNPRHFVIRTAWLYGSDGHFLNTILRKMNQADQISVIHDQTGTPTSVVDLSNAILSLIGSEQYGLYHGVCEGSCSWFDFAVEIARHCPCRSRIVPCSCDDYPFHAKRPRYSVLENRRLTLETNIRFGFWRDALRQYLKRERYMTVKSS